MPMQPGQGPLHEGRPSPQCYHTILGCDCDWCVKRRADKNASAARSIAIRQNPKSLVTPEQFAQARDRIVYWHDVRGMSQQQIRLLCGLASATQVMLTLGTPSRRTHSMRLATYRLIMAPPMDAQPPMESYQRRSGVPVPILGPRRRLQALNAIGFDCNTVASVMPNVIGRNLAEIARGYGSRNRQSVTREMAEDIDAAYRKLSSAKPEDYGIRRHVQACAISRAVRYGYAPPACWDDDTIDDPAAIPDWTGACGSYKGYARHRAAGIPSCQPCRDAANYRNRNRDDAMAV